MEDRKTPNPIDLALGGLGQDQNLPGASGRPWAPAWVPRDPGACPLTGQEKVITLSALGGAMVKVDVRPVNPDIYIEISRLPTRQQRKGALGVSFYDLPGVQAIAMEQGYRLEYAPEVLATIDQWNRWCLDLEHTRTFAEFPDFHVAGLDIDFLHFQRRGVAYGVKIGSFLCGDQMGLGKSIQALGILFTHRQALGGRIDTMLLAPTSVVGDWRKKFLKFAKIEIGVADGTKSQRVKVYERRPEFLGLSYDVFLRDIKEIANNFRPKAVVADECQRFTNRKSKAAGRLFDFVDVMQPQWRIPMSGSPISNRPDDLWPILRLINPVLAGSAKCFEGRYLKSKPIWKRDPATGKGVMMKIEYGTGDKKRSFTPMRLESLDPDKPAEARLLHELRLKIAPFVVRRLKKDVLSDLPDKMFETISIKLGKKEREVYEELQARFAEAMAGVADDGAEGAVSTFFEWFTKAQQICSSLEITGQGTESSKIDELRDFVRDYADDQKILIFSRFHTMTEIVARELKEYNPVHMHGGVQQSKRQPMVDKFQDDPGCRLFISTLKAGGVGLTLTAGSIVVRLDRWVSPVANEQAVDRAHRIGQTKQVTVVDFVVEDSVEERILEILDKKIKMIASLILADDDEEVQDRKVIRSLRKSEMLALI